MSASALTRALRTLVAELAELGDADLDAILSDLEPHERNQLLGLMAEYREGDRLPDKVQGAELTLSQWLSDRLQGAAPLGMTPAAVDALQQSAAGAGWRDSHTNRPGSASQTGLRAWLGRRP